MASIPHPRNWTDAAKLQLFSEMYSVLRERRDGRDYSTMDSWTEDDKAYALNVLNERGVIKALALGKEIPRADQSGDYESTPDLNALIETPNASS